MFIPNAYITIIYTRDKRWWIWLVYGFNLSLLPRGDVRVLSKRMNMDGFPLRTCIIRMSIAFRSPMEKRFQLRNFVGSRLNTMYRAVFCSASSQPVLTITNHYQPARGTGHFFAILWSAPKTAGSLATALCAAPPWPLMLASAMHCSARCPHLGTVGPEKALSATQGTRIKQNMDV